MQLFKEKLSHFSQLILAERALEEAELGSRTTTYRAWRSKLAFRHGRFGSVRADEFWSSIALNKAKNVDCWVNDHAMSN